MNIMGESGVQRSTSFFGGSYNFPPLSFGLMMNTPMSRLRASKMAGKTEIEARVVEIGDEEAARRVCIVNAQRKGLNPIEQAVSFKMLSDKFNMSQEVAEASTRNLFFSAESGAPFQEGLKALAGMMLANKMLDSEPKWDEFINTSFI